MERLIKKLLIHRGAVVFLFIAASAMGFMLSNLVSVNYDLSEYLPAGTPSTVALDILEDAFGDAIPNVRVLVPGVSVTEALAYKAKLAAVAGVTGVQWLDDQVSVLVPLETLAPSLTENWYKDGSALFMLTVEKTNQQKSLADIRAIIGDAGAMSGNPVETVLAQSTTGMETRRMMILAVPLMLTILMLVTHSWFEPVLFLAGIGVSIGLNMGTNLIFDRISFITQATAAILQLACSMDYSVFLLDRFEELRASGLAPLDAMALAVKKSASAILSSGMTTVMGFVALVAMRFKVGEDLGFVLAKGIAFSLVGALIFLPCLTLFCHKLIDKTRHRPLTPSFKGFAQTAVGMRGLTAALVLLIFVPAFLAQRQVNFFYGVSGIAEPGSQVAVEREQINEQFGKISTFVLMAPKGSVALEQQLHSELEALPEVSGVVSYVGTVGQSIPEPFVPAKALSQLNSDEYTRMILSARVSSESEETFALVERIRSIADQYYPDSAHLVGESASIYDMKSTITADSVKVNLISAGAIGLILLITFRSFSLPFLLLLTIESSIFINVSIPYFTGQTLNYIGFLIISSIQLGATVDYAILFASRYLENRGSLDKKEAALKTVSDTVVSIFTSGGILATGGLLLSAVSTNGMIAELGILIARGAALSALLVLFFLPALLTLLDGLIQKTTLGLRFYHISSSQKEVRTP